MSDKCLGSLSSTAEKPFSRTNSGVLGHRMKEDEGSRSFKLTTNCGLHHGVSMVASVSKFSGFSFSPRAW